MMRLVRLWSKRKLEQFRRPEVYKTHHKSTGCQTPVAGVWHSIQHTIRDWNVRKTYIGQSQSSHQLLFHMATSSIQPHAYAEMASDDSSVTQHGNNALAGLLGPAGALYGNPQVRKVVRISCQQQYLWFYSIRCVSPTFYNFGKYLVLYMANMAPIFRMPDYRRSGTNYLDLAAYEFQRHFLCWVNLLFISNLVPI